MRNFISMAAAAALLFTLPACSTSQLDSFRLGLGNFQAGVAAVDQTIGQVSPTLAKHCGEAQDVGSALAGLIGTSSSASGGLAAINAAITTWCSAPPTDIKSAIASVVAQVAAGKAAYNAAKRGN